jgi:frataxin-like iron-binding protein CyaY
VIEIQRYLSDEMKITIQGAGVFKMTQDSDTQVILIDSPLSGNFCFDYSYGRWIDINNEYVLSSFFEGELNKIQNVDGFL